MKYTIAALVSFAAVSNGFTHSAFMGKAAANVPKSTSALDMRYKVAVVGGGPSGACAAEIFAQEKGIDTVLFERKLDNAKPCGGAIPLCMVGEFNIPESVVDRKVRYLFRRFESCGESAMIDPFIITQHDVPIIASHQMPPCFFCVSSCGLPDAKYFSHVISVLIRRFFPLMRHVGPQDEPHLADWCRSRYR